MKTGQCKFGATCKFHHPVLPAVEVPPPSPTSQVAPLPTPLSSPTLYPRTQSPSGPLSQQYGVVMASSPLMPGSYVQGPYGQLLISPGMVSFPSWNPYPVGELKFIQFP